MLAAATTAGTSPTPSDQNTTSRSRLCLQHKPSRQEQSRSGGATSGAAVHPQLAATAATRVSFLSRRRRFAAAAKPLRPRPGLPRLSSLARVTW